MNTDYISEYFIKTIKVIEKIDKEAVSSAVAAISEMKKTGGRLFILGVGGSAANASHAVNDFRKIAGIEAYAPTDNVSELTARTNDEGFQTVFEEWLKTSRLSKKDAVLIFSVGGGSEERNISANLVRAVKYAKSSGAKIIGIVGRDGGYTAKAADVCIIIPALYPEAVTPITESLQLLIEHLIVTHPLLSSYKGKWETIKE